MRMRILVKTLVSIFIAAHITMMVTSGLPDRSVVGQRILNHLRDYQVFFGLDQTWSMFAPNPSSVNSYLDATITFKDGSTEKWTFPRSSQLSDWDRFTGGERFRKYQQENLKAMERNEIWLDLGHFLEKEVNRIERSGRGRVFEQAQFYRHFNTVKPPTEQFIEHGKLSTNYQTESVFQYKPTEQVRHEAKNDH